MNTPKVISREYKLALEAGKFAGTQAEVKKQARAFWTALKAAVKPMVKTTSGTLGAISATRTIRFYDTEDRALNNKNYIFRERISTTDGQREVTLKFRHPDRYVAQERDMQPAAAGKAKVKFEEDIKEGFLQLYSFSGSAEIAAKKKIATLKDVVKIYTGVGGGLGKQGSKTLQPVNGFEAKEIVITGAQLKLCNKPEVLAECALIIWYDAQKDNKQPVICEFSFRYGNAKEKYNRKTAQCAYELFKQVQEQMKDWAATDKTTKTAFVFQG